MRERYQSSIRLRLVVPILSALLVVIGILSGMSEAMLSASLENSAKNSAARISGLLARDPEINTGLISAGGTDGIEERLEDLLANEMLVLAIGIYVAEEAEEDYRLLHAEMGADGLCCLTPDTIDPAAMIITRSPCKRHNLPSHDLIVVTHPIDDNCERLPRFGDLAKKSIRGPHRAESSVAKPLGAVRLAYSLRSAEEAKANYRFWIFLVACFLVLSSGLAANRLTRYMLEPIHKVHAALQEATDGNLKVRMEETTRDELGAIANRFNLMVTRLDTNREEIRIHNRTLEKRVEERTEELSRAYCELQSLDKVKDSILSNVSHEMRTPLTSIVASTEILAEFTDQDESARREFLNIIKKEAARLLRQISSILDLAKMEAETPTLLLVTTDLNKILDCAIEQLFHSLQKKNITVNCHCTEKEMISHCDTKQLSKVILSVLENAITYSPEGGTIDIDLEYAGDDIALEITDDGPGVPETKQGLLFTSFGQLCESLTDKPSGLGIGLAISKRIAEAHNGNLQYVHRPQRGACFQLTLPAPAPVEASLVVSQL